MCLVGKFGSDFQNCSLYRFTARRVSFLLWTLLSAACLMLFEFLSNCWKTILLILAFLDSSTELQTVTLYLCFLKAKL